MADSFERPQLKDPTKASWLNLAATSLRPAGVQAARLGAQEGGQGHSAIRDLRGGGEAAQLLCASVPRWRKAPDHGKGRRWLSRGEAHGACHQHYSRGIPTCWRSHGCLLALHPRLSGKWTIAEGERLHRLQKESSWHPWCGWCRAARREGQGREEEVYSRG